MNKKDTPVSRYWKIGPIYIKKTFLLLLIAAASVFVIGICGFPAWLLPDWQQNTLVYRYDDPKLQEIEKTVQIRDDKGVIRYIGPVENGVCSGNGRVYDSQGRLCYKGPIVENRWEGENAKVYQNNRLIYTGTMENNRYEGPGRLFDYEKKEIWEGEFHNDLPEGTIRIYDLEGRLLGQKTVPSGEKQEETLLDPEKRKEK